MPVAIICWVKPRASVKLVGDRVMDCRVGVVTVTMAVPDTRFRLAVMVAVPPLMAVTRPLGITSPTLATVGVSEVQVT